MPALDGLKNVPFLDSTSIMELDTVPEHLLVLGGGYVGLEFAQMFRRFGSRVSIVQSGGQLLGHEDIDVAAEVAALLKQDGIEVMLMMGKLAYTNLRDAVFAHPTLAESLNNLFL